MVDDFIHEVTVVTHDNDTTMERLKVFFEHLQGNNVQIVGRLVENQEVRASHEHRTEVQTPTLASTEFVDVIVLLVRREKEVLQELHCRQLTAAAKVDILGDVSDNVDDLRTRVVLHLILGVITESDGFSHTDMA